MSDLRLDHVADFYRRYPGEAVTFYTRVQAQTFLSTGFTLTLRLPTGLQAGAYRGEGVPTLAVLDGEYYLTWRVERVLAEGEALEYQLETTVAPMQDDETLVCSAWVNVDDGPALARDSASIAVAAKGRYLRYLPAIYADDELMGRFLMLFESFWKPTQQKIDHIADYFDPGLAPPDLLPWLASWLHLTLDERWPEDKRRHLLRSAASLYRQRGTRQGLHRYLEIYTGVRPRLTEQGANNLRLGREARLGPSVALGKLNRPHTFTVTLRLPPVPVPPDAPEGEAERLEQERRRTIERIIEAEKPAHTAFTLNLES